MNLYVIRIMQYEEKGFLTALFALNPVRIPCLFLTFQLTSTILIACTPKTIARRKQKLPLLEKKRYVADALSFTLLGYERLTDLGYNVVVKTSSVEALEALRLGPERFDLVITDQTTPSLTGEGLARALRRIRPDIPVILCTGCSPLLMRRRPRRRALMRSSCSP